MSVASAGVKAPEAIFGKIAIARLGYLRCRTVTSSRHHISAIAALDHCTYESLLTRSHLQARQPHAGRRPRHFEWGNWEFALSIPDVVVSSVASKSPYCRAPITGRSNGRAFQRASS